MLWMEIAREDSVGIAAGEHVRWILTRGPFKWQIINRVNRSGFKVIRRAAPWPTDDLDTQISIPLSHESVRCSLDELDANSGFIG